MQQSEKCKVKSEAADCETFVAKYVVGHALAYTIDWVYHGIGGCMYRSTAQLHWAPLIGVRITHTHTHDSSSRKDLQAKLFFDSTFKCVDIFLTFS